MSATAHPDARRHTFFSYIHHSACEGACLVNLVSCLFCFLLIFPQPCHFPTTLSSPLAPTSPPSASSTSAVLSRRQSPSAPARWREFAQLANSLPPTQTGQYLDIEPDMKHAPLIISESGCNTNTKTVSTPRQKLQDKLVLDGRRSPILKKNDATRYRSACMRLSYLAQDRLDLAETAKHLALRMSETRDFDFVLLKRAARYLVGKPRAALRFRRQKHVHKITVFVDHDFAGQTISRKSKTGLAAQIGNHTLKSGSTLQSLTTNYIDTRYFWIQERVQDEDISIKTVLTAKNCAQMLERSQSLLQYYNIASLQDWYSTDQGSHTPLQYEETSKMSSRYRTCTSETDILSTLIVNIEMDVQAE